MERNKNRSGSKPSRTVKRERITRKDTSSQNQPREEKNYSKDKDKIQTSNKIVLKKKEPFKKFDEKPGDRNQYSSFSLPRRDRPKRTDVLDLNEIKQRNTQPPPPLARRVPQPRNGVRRGKTPLSQQQTFG